MIIKGTGIVSPQETFARESLPDKIIEYTETHYLKCIEPPYREFIDPMEGRRMSRIIKMGVCAAKVCMRNAGIDMPDAIITGTGLGCIEDTEKFMGSIIRNGERLLNPTPFIQSTHNTIAAAIALAIKCHNYNSTYVHRGFSFENALQDSMLFLKENPGKNVLLGGLDEITKNSYFITSRLRLWKNRPVNNLSLLDYQDRGSLAGEGVSFFMLGNYPDTVASARIKAMGTLYRPEDRNAVERKLSDFLADAEVTPRELDLIIYGLNGDGESDRIYHQLRSGLFRNMNGAYYKHLCGEYDTSVAFALWLAYVIFKQQATPDIVKLKPCHTGAINNILIYNHLRNINHSMLLITKC